MLSLARTLRERLPHAHSSLRNATRGFAEVVNVKPPAEGVKELEVPASSSLRPVNWRRERVPVREDHGLYAFFRKKEPKIGVELEGDDKYEVVDTPNTMHTVSGRGWKSEELRLKSFKDLHMLWYVLVRERNLLATQKEEARRMGVASREIQVNGTKVYHVRKSMARIKQLLNERRIAYEKAYSIASTAHNAYHVAKGSAAVTATLTALRHLSAYKRRLNSAKTAKAKAARRAAAKIEATES